VVDNIYAEALSLFDYTRGLRRDFHKHPELGLKEFRTSGIVQKELDKMGLQVTSGIAETGVIGLLEGKAPGKVILLRFDMDALPVQEETGAEYSSQHAGLMHACGHDGHVAIGLAAARLLANHRKDFVGTVKFVFQPGEEGLGGAEKMVNEGVLENPRPDMVLAMHLWNDRPVGWVGVSAGPVMAGADTFHVKLQGKGGHGAIPQQTIDPVLTAAHVVTALQSIVSRNVSPLKSAVVSVTSISAGHAFNVIPPTAELLGTIRTFDPEIRQYIKERFEHIVKNTAAAFGCESECEVNRITPAVINDKEITEKVVKSIQEVLPNSIVEKQYQTMGSEDMSFFMEKVPGSYFFVGTANQEKGLNFGHHHPKFDFDEEALPKGVAMISQASLGMLK